MNFRKIEQKVQVNYQYPVVFTESAFDLKNTALAEIFFGANTAAQFGKPIPSKKVLVVVGHKADAPQCHNA